MEDLAPSDKPADWLTVLRMTVNYYFVSFKNKIKFCDTIGKLLFIFIFLFFFFSFFLKQMDLYSTDKNKHTSFFLTQAVSL